MSRDPRVAAVALAAALSTTVLAAQSKAVTPVQLLSRGITLYATDDATTEAERLLLQAAKTAGRNTKEADTAIYYLGRYFHRNYYMLRQQDAIKKAIDRYKDVHVGALGTERGGARYADARFYKGLAYLESAEWVDAYEAVDHLRPELDDTIEVDYLIWTPGNKRLNVNVPSGLLRARYLAVADKLAIRSRAKGRKDPQTVSAMIAELSATLQQNKRAAGRHAP